MKFGKILALTVALGAVVALSSTSALAICPNSATFGQITYACAGSFCYVVSPGESTNASITATFWNLTLGDPTEGAGIDNGSYTDDTWLRPYGGNFYMSGDWSSGVGIDGCAEIANGGTEQMVAMFSDTDAAGNAYWAAAAVTRNRVSGGTPYDFTFEGGGGTPQNINLIQLPAVQISGSVRDGANAALIDVSVVCPDLSAGYYTDGSITFDQVVQGCDVRQQIVTQGAGAPSDRDNGWVSIGTVANGTTGAVTVDCSSDTTGDAYLGIGVAVDSGFNSFAVGGNSSVVACDPNLADPGDRNFRLIDDRNQKPGKGKGRGYDRKGGER